MRAHCRHSRVLIVKHQTIFCGPRVGRSRLNVELGRALFVLVLQLQFETTASKLDQIEFVLVAVHGLVH
jgi:hypothetical protein